MFFFTIEQGEGIVTYRNQTEAFSFALLFQWTKELLLQNEYPAGVINYNINDVLNRQQSKPKNPTTTVPRKEFILVLPFLGLQSKIVTKQLKTCINKFYCCINSPPGGYSLIWDI